MATMRDVARRANVSIATVSFVVNNTKRVAPATRARILAAMEELGFRRNVVARALASRRTRIIALLFPALDRRLDSTALSIVTSAAEAAHARGYNLVLWPISNDADQMTDLIAGGLADGVLLMAVQMEDARVDHLMESGTPFTLIGRTREPEQLSYVDIDFDGTVTAALDYLTGLGHERIALIIERPDGSNLAGYGPVVRTESSYRDRMAERALDPVIVSCKGDPVGGRGAAAELLRVAPETTAVIVMNEDAAFGLVSGLAHAGLRVPNDVSILSISTTPEMGATSDPPLSTMNAPGKEMGRLGVEALIDQLEGKPTHPTQVLLLCELQLGESTGPTRTKLPEEGRDAAPRGSRSSRQ
jgi:DNA-binding LacI/PurR family transcriptional regulator